MAAAAGQAPPHLLDLPEDVLLRIGLQLTLNERLRLAEVCRKLRQLCAGPSELWRVIRVRLRADGGGDAALEALVRFRRWLRPRLATVEQLQLFNTVSLAQAAPVPLLDQLLAGSGAGLPHHPPLPLARVVLLWPGAMDFDPGTLAQLPALRSLMFYDSRLRVTGQLPVPPEHGGQPVALPPLTDFGVDGGQLHLVAPAAWGNMLPPSVTALKLCDCDLGCLPGALLNSLPQLRSLKVHRNELVFRPLASPLASCTALELLNLSCCGLRRFPSQLSGLTRLKVLYLHGAFRRTLDPASSAVPEAAWDALRPLTALRFLAISANSLPALPPAVAQMGHLHALHCEQNSFAVLPLGPYLCGLRELLLGWHTALGSRGALWAATRLSRLVLWRTSLQEAPADPDIGLPVEAGEALVEALAAMPALKRVDDDMKRPGSYLLHPAVAQAMLRMGQRCPHLQLGLLQGKSIGWGMSRLREAEQEEEREAQQAQQAGQQLPSNAS